MQINYKSPKLQGLCSDFRKATKVFNLNVAENLIATVNYIESAESLMDVQNYPPFHFHQEMEITQKEFALRLNTTGKSLSELVNGHLNKFSNVMLVIPRT